MDSFNRIRISFWCITWTFRIRTTPNCWWWPASPCGPNAKNGAKMSSSRNSDPCVIISLTCLLVFCFEIHFSSSDPVEGKVSALEGGCRRRLQRGQRAGKLPLDDINAQYCLFYQPELIWNILCLLFNWINLNLNEWT